MILNLYKCLCLLVLGICPLLVLAQDNSTTNFTISIKNWENLHDQGKYDEAIAQAEKAFLLAEQLGDKESMAVALNKEGTSLLRKTRRVSRNLKKAKEKFEKSLFSRFFCINSRKLSHLSWICKKI